MGSIGGSIFQGIKGFRNAPIGFSRRMNGALTSIATRAPILGGSFAVWGGLFSVVDCSLIRIRQKEDPWNSIMSGAATGGILAMRSGKTAIITSAVVGGVLLGFIEGMGLLFQRFAADQMNQGEHFVAINYFGKQKSLILISSF